MRITRGSDEGRRHRLRIGDRTSLEIEDYVSPNTKETVMITGLGFPAHSVSVAKAVESRISVFGRELSHDGKNGHAAPFAWSA